ncbi:UNVERIFIED_CONTAM: hypothetical protein GTU68_013541 [Idotea baltica]|nr:hypothetical protein [Idotea baltica]
MNINFDLLKKISEEAGTSGFEKRIRDLVIAEVTPLVDKVTVDHIGNVIALKKGKSPKKVMLAAHMDEIGFIVSHIDEKTGIVYFNPLGGFDPKTLTSMRVLIQGKEDVFGVMGGKPIHLMTAKERGEKLALDKYYIDTGLPAEKVKELIPIGSPVTRIGDLEKLGDHVVGKSLDNRVSVFILIEAMRELANQDLPYDTYAVFTVQEEIGCRGAWVATHTISPDFGICLDTTIAFDTPEAKPQERISELGKGTAIKVMDSGTVCDYRMVDYMKKTADKNNITYQMELLTRGGTDTLSQQRMADDGGAICGAISIPTRNIHQTVEICNPDDIRLTIDLTKACIIGLDNYDWSH